MLCVSLSDMYVFSSNSGVKLLSRDTAVMYAGCAANYVSDMLLVSSNSFFGCKATNCGQDTKVM